MIDNFRPSNLGLFGVPLQARAREKKERETKITIVSNERKGKQNKKRKTNIDILL